jgi:hypothetical protein
MSKGWSLRKLTLFVYLFNLLFGLFIGLQFYWILEEGRAFSWYLLGWTGEWDHALVQDFIQNNRSSIKVIRREALLLIPTFVVLNIFVSAGILFCGKYSKSDWFHFWSGGTRFFLSFMGNFLFFIVIYAVWTFAIAGSGLAWAANHLQNVGSEIGASYIVAGMGSLYLLGMIYLINVSSVSKTMIIEGEDYRSAITRGFRKGTALALPLFMIFMVFLILVVVVGGFTKIAVDSVGTFSMFTLVLGFLLYQAFIFSRSLFRVMYLVSVQRAATEEDDR